MGQPLLKNKKVKRLKQKNSKVALVRLCNNSKADAIFSSAAYKLRDTDIA